MATPPTMHRINAIEMPRLEPLPHSFASTRMPRFIFFARLRTKLGCFAGVGSWSLIIIEVGAVRCIPRKIWRVQRRIWTQRCCCREESGLGDAATGDYACRLGDGGNRWSVTDVRQSVGAYRCILYPRRSILLLVLNTTTRFQRHSIVIERTKGPELHFRGTWKDGWIPHQHRSGGTVVLSFSHAVCCLSLCASVF